MAAWPTKWNHNNKVVNPKTNNHLEGFHTKVNKNFNSAHPNIFLFLDTVISFKFLCLSCAANCGRSQCNTVKCQIFVFA